MIGCADRQDEAEKLGQEVTQQESAGVDSSAADVDTTGVGAADDAESSEADAAATPAETEHIPDAPPGEGFTVQIAACTDYEHAQYLIDLFRKRGYEPYMTKSEVNGESFYRVRVGAYPAAAEAEQLRAELLDKYSLETWIDNKTE